MAHNKLSGSVVAPEYFGPKTGAPGTNILSGTFKGDGADILGVARIVANGSTDNMLTVGSDAYSMVGEPNLTFNGSVLTITGDITGSNGISASFFEGDGSRLTGISAGGGGGAGIFTTIDGSHAYVTSSLNIGGTTSADHKLVVSGSLSASVNISASAFYGDGSRLTGISAGTASAQGPTYSIQFSTGSNVLSGSAKLLFDTSALTLTGTLNVSGAINLDGNLIPTVANTHDLGSAANPWRNLYISSSTVYFGSNTLSVGPDDNLKFGSGSTTKGFDVGFMNFRNNGIFMDPGRLFKLRAYQIQMYGGIGFVRKVVADDYTIQEIDYLVGIQSDALTSSITLTLPEATGLLNGQTYVIKDEGGALNSYPVTLTCSAGDTIDGQNQIVLESPYTAIQLYCNGINKYFVC